MQFLLTLVKACVYQFLSLTFRAIFLFFRAAERVEIVVQPDNGTFTEGNTGIFTCVASGKPSTPSIAWWMNEIELYNSSAEGRVKLYQETVEVKGATFLVSYLEICGITMDDAGVYSCSAYLPSANVTSGEFRVSVTSALRKTTEF